MKKRYYLFISILLMLAGCSNIPTLNEQFSKINSAETIRKEIDKFMKNKLLICSLILLSSCSNTISYLDKIQGMWALNKQDNVVFIIKNNTVIYPEDEGTLNFELNDDTISLSDEGHPITKWKILKITSDSLYLKMEDNEVVKYVRIR